MPARVIVFGIVNVVLAALGVLLCGALLLTCLGFGTLIALSSFKSFGAGVMFGGLGALLSLFGMLLCLLQAYIGAAMMQGRTLGFVGGLALSAFALIGATSGGLYNVVYGVFGLWALLTASDRFR
ncbi:MAG: hypothetical protein KC468_02130 [Myxococcales bacterium]|nr:hypothetical protein [Myxococcales bacterium]